MLRIIMIIIMAFILYKYLFENYKSNNNNERFGSVTTHFQSYPLIYDAYMSTHKDFNWEGWYLGQKYFPPFIFKDGRYFLPSVLATQYPKLFYNGVPSLTQKRENFTKEEIGDSIKKLKKLDIGFNILASLSEPESSTNIINMIKVEKPLV